MNAEFQRCIESGRITSFPQGPALAKKELSTANSDLTDARKSLSEERYKWATIQGYYAMFHAARALVYSRGYREKSHHCLAVALRALFVDEKRLRARAVRDFLNAMNLREAADYEADFSEKGAAAVIKAAERFIARTSMILTR
ncbi:MAG: HEPN domain-containing protein [Chloroflexota bacterium]